MGLWGQQEGYEALYQVLRQTSSLSLLGFASSFLLLHSC